MQFFVSLKMVTISKVKVISGHIPRQAAPYPKQSHISGFFNSKALLIIFVHAINSQIHLSKSCCKASAPYSLINYHKLFLFKMAAILRNLEQLGRYFALHTMTTQSMCLQNIFGISVIMRALDPGQRFEHTFWILLRWWLQRHQKHIGSTLHVEPKNILFLGGMTISTVSSEEKKPPC